MNKYVLVQFPESQELMDSERFNECLLVQDINGHDEVRSSAYMCPEDLYEQIFNTNKIQSKRINNIEFRKAAYLGKEPKFPNWTIDYWYPNPLYKKENNYERIGDFYIEKDKEIAIRHHKSCFKYKESCYSIASFVRNDYDIYELQFIENRPLYLNDKEISDFWELVKYGYKALNKLNDGE